MSDPKLVKASLLTRTGDEDRDHDSCINVEVRTADQGTMIATALLSQCDGQYGYGNNTTNEFDIPLTPQAASLTLGACQRFQFRMGITPTGQDEWKFDAWLILQFDDGTKYWNDKLSQDIHASNPFNHKQPAFQCDWNFSQVSPPP